MYHEHYNFSLFINSFFYLLNKIDDLLKKAKKEDVVKISLPVDKLDMDKVDADVREAIHERYIAERIGNDIFIKVSLNSRLS